MKNLILSLVVLLSIYSCKNSSHKDSLTENQETKTNIIPIPVTSNSTDGSLTLPDDIYILAPSEEEIQIASFLQEYLTAKEIHSTVQSDQTGEPSITLLIDSSARIEKEGYHLSVKENGIVIKAGTGAGLFYGVQTLLQLLDDQRTLALVEIIDHPRFSYRGLHLDVCRHMFSVDFVKRYIDLMSHYKYNTFHWHLTEDQGWRIEIKKYPNLQEVGAYRDETIIGHASSATRGQGKYDGKRYGGYYTQEEIKDVIDYASKRYITIIPEIEMPGHSLAALTAYPYLGCTGGPYKVATTWGVFDDVYCAGKETTFEFLEDVIDEVVELFPSEYIHIGGDESPKAKWEKCPHCQKRIKDEKLKDEHELQSYFVQRMEKYINSKGKKIIGWDEILEGGLAPNATVMSWRGEEGGIAAAKEKHNVIMTPVGWCYLDYYQADPEKEPLAIGSLIPVSKVYDYDPIPSELEASAAQYILGGQCNLWTEYITTPEHAEYMVYPRAIAMAEVLWSPKENKNYDNFVKRMEHHRSWLDLWGVNYATHIFETAK